jgi:hypothetical protein
VVLVKLEERRVEFNLEDRSSSSQGFLFGSHSPPLVAYPVIHTQSLVLTNHKHDEIISNILI